MAHNKEFPILEKIQILDLAAEGKAIARHENHVIFVTGAVPGDVVDLRILRKRKKFMEAIPIHFHELSGERVEPVCSHFGICGGCKWQQLDYSRQLFYKEKQVRDQFERIGKIPVQLISPILASSNTTFYRNKLEFTFSARRWITDKTELQDEESINRNALGFHMPGRFDRVLQIDFCHLQPEPSNEIRNAVNKFARDNSYTFYDPISEKGYLRNLTIRNTQDGQVMVILSVHDDEQEQLEKILDFIWTQFSGLHSLMYLINSKVNDSMADMNVMLYKGGEYLVERMENLSFRIGPKSFFQTNTSQGLRLYEITREFAALTGNEVVYDLYTGTGTIALFISSKAKKIIGIEYVEEAIADAKINAEFNSIHNCEFVAGDMNKIFTDEFIFANGKPDVIILDPPRAGVHEKVIAGILYALPERIVYVSCNPATQARDIALLSEKYEVTRVQPVDMFPHTQHVENVALLMRILPKITPTDN
jgi:23S rRNA (uracil1939-C5)-methyltransferase